MLTKFLAVDGEYCSLIRGAIAPIYCHGMQTSDPKEYHPAGTSKDSDKCDLSKDSEIAPLTLGSMDNSFFYHLFCFTQGSYLSKDLGEISIWKNL